jgi:acyl-CoA synthetase (AMP-forming)/AMP-acid ligase II
VNLAELLAAQAAASPRAPAIIDVCRGRTRAITFAELELAAAQASSLLYESGLRPGDAVLVFQPMSIELYIALAAIFRMGLVAMFLDPRAGHEHIEQCCALWTPRALIASPKAHLLRFTSRALRQIPIQFSVGMPLPWAASFSRLRKCKPKEPLARDEDLPALVTFTSGSTGRPKAALRTHHFLLNQQQVLEQSLQLKAGEVDLTTLPTFALANLASGVTTVIPAVDPLRAKGAGLAMLVAQMKAHGVNRLGAAPAFLERLADYCLAQTELLSGVGKVFTGGGPVFPSTLEKMSLAAPNAVSTAVYGCTEAEPIALLRRGDISQQDRAAMTAGAGLLAGKTERALQVRIIPDRNSPMTNSLTATEFEAGCLKAGEAGEIVVSGAHVLRSYLNGSDNAGNSIHAGDTAWHRTGDAGYLDRQSRLWLLGRCCARVDDQYGTIYPLQVEVIVRQRARDCRATLISSRGQRILVAERENLPDWKDLEEAFQRCHLDRLHTVPRLPFDKRHRSKIDYSALKEMAASFR